MKNTTPPFTPSVTPPSTPRPKPKLQTKVTEEGSPMSLYSLENAKDSQHLLLLEPHEDVSPKRFVIDMMENNRTNVLFMEHISHTDGEYFEHTDTIDYLKKWLNKPVGEVIKKLTELRNQGLVSPPNSEEEDLEATDTENTSERNKISSTDKERMLSIVIHLRSLDKNYMSESYRNDPKNTFVGVIKSAIEKGVRIVPIDHQDIYHDRFGERIVGEERVESFNNFSSGIINKYLEENKGCKSITFIGSAHGARSNLYPDIISMGEILGMPSAYVTDEPIRLSEIRKFGSFCKQNLSKSTHILVTDFIIDFNRDRDYLNIDGLEKVKDFFDKNALFHNSVSNLFSKIKDLSGNTEFTDHFRDDNKQDLTPEEASVLLNKLRDFMELEKIPAEHDTALLSRINEKLDTNARDYSLDFNTDEYKAPLNQFIEYIYGKSNDRPEIEEYGGNIQGLFDKMLNKASENGKYSLKTCGRVYISASLCVAKGGVVHSNTIATAERPGSRVTDNSAMNFAHEISKGFNPSTPIIR